MGAGFHHISRRKIKRNGQIPRDLGYWLPNGRPQSEETGIAIQFRQRKIPLKAMSTE
jgi:hypothetical protein